MSGNEAAGRSVISKLSAILLAFTEGGKLSVSDVAHLSGLPMSTAHRLVTELAAWRLLERDHDRRFRPALPLRALGGKYCCSTTSIRDMASPILDDLYRAIGREVRFGVLDGKDLRYIHKSSAHVPVSQFTAAATLPLHATALGKVLMAFAEPEILDLIPAPELRAFTANTIVDRDRLRWNLMLVKRSRFALSDRELRSDYCAIAAPIFGSTGRPVAALEVRVVDLAAMGQIERPALTVAAAGLSRDLCRSCCCGRPAAEDPVTTLNHPSA